MCYLSQRVIELILQYVSSVSRQRPRSLSGSSELSSALSPDLVLTPQTSSSGSCWPPPAFSTPQPPSAKPGRKDNYYSAINWNSMMCRISSKWIISHMSETHLQRCLLSVLTAVLSHYFQQWHGYCNLCGGTCTCIYNANLCRTLYFRHSLLQQGQVEVPEHLTRGERPLQGVEVPLNHRQTPFTALLLIWQILEKL